MQISPKPHFRLLDLFRGGAAFLVLLEHARNYTMVDYSATAKCGLIWKIIYCLSGLGHLAVVIFFVLSGCLVGMVVVRDVSTGRWEWKRYFFNRLTRLWLVLIPALLITALLDGWTINLAPQGSFVFHGAFANIQLAPLAERRGWDIFIGNSVFLQTITVAPFGSNGPLWSLAYEFWYYLIFPFLYLAFQPKATARRRLAYFLLGLLSLALVGQPIATYFVLWLMGAAAFILLRNLRVSRGVAICGLALSSTLLVGAMLAYRFALFEPLLPGFSSLAAIGAVCAMTLYFAMQVTLPPILSGIAHWFSKFSYTLYLVHLPFLTFLISFFIRNNGDRLQPGPTAAVVLTSLILLAYGFSYGIFLLTEKHTDAVRGKLVRLIAAARTKA